MTFSGGALHLSFRQQLLAVLMPFEMAEQLTRTLVDALIKAKQAPRQTPETETATKLAEKSDNFADRIFSDGSRLRS